MTDPAHVKVCLTCRDYPDPVLAAFLVADPGIRGGCILHLLEQAPLRAGLTVPRPDLITLIQSHAAPDSAVRAEFRVFPESEPDLPPNPVREHPTVDRAREILREHALVGAVPVGLDTADADDMARLSLLPEHPLAPRRVDDFPDHDIREAMLAIYRHFAVDRRIPLLYHGYADPTTGWFAFPSAPA